LFAIVVVGLVGWQLYGIVPKLDSTAFWSGIKQPENQWRIFLVLLLMPVNWMLETLKWRSLLQAFLPWTFSRTFRAVIAGVSVGAITPNRIGEIGGRLLVGSKEEAPGILASSLLGSLCQWLVFLLVALPCLLWVAGDFLPPYLLPFRWLGLLIIPIVAFLLGRGGTRWLAGLLRWVEQRTNWSLGQLPAVLNDFPLATLLTSTGWAALRFLTYVTQLFLLLNVFGIALPLFKGMAGIAAIYLIQAGIPLPPGVNLLTRAELGILLWGDDPATVGASLAAFTTLFVVNVLLPALPAYWLIVKRP
jgi:hypothetical protein